MARKAAKKAVADEASVSQGVQRLKEIGLDEMRFAALIAEFENDRALAPADLIAIAWGYGGGGVKPSSRSKALEKIRRRFNELKLREANLEIASKARPW